MEENKISLQIIGEGELLVSDSSGQQLLLDDMVLDTIYEFYDTVRVKKLLLSEKEVAEEPENIRNIDPMTRYYIEKRNELLDLMHKLIFLSYAFDQLDADDWEEERARYDAILGYDMADAEDTY